MIQLHPPQRLIHLSSSFQTQLYNVSGLWRRARAGVYNMMFQMGLRQPKITYYELVLAKSDTEGKNPKYVHREVLYETS